jgi:hypothetical protein
MLLSAGRKTLASARLAAVTSCLVAVAASTTTAGECSYFNAATDQSADGDCTTDYDGEKEIVRVGKSEFVFVQERRQGQWAVGTLNGKPAVRYEVNRVTYSYSTLDLTEFLDRSDE